MASGSSGSRLEDMHEVTTNRACVACIDAIAVDRAGAQWRPRGDSRHNELGMSQQRHHLPRGHIVGRHIYGKSLPTSRSLADSLCHLADLSVSWRTMALLAQLSLI